MKMITILDGKNPWSLSNLWMAKYNLERNKEKEALENLRFVTNTANIHGFIPEQIDNELLEPKWIIGLTWAHRNVY